MKLQIRATFIQVSITTHEARSLSGVLPTMDREQTRPTWSALPKGDSASTDKDVYIDSDGTMCRGCVCIYLEDLVVFSKDAQQTVGMSYDFSMYSPYFSTWRIAKDFVNTYDTWAPSWDQANFTTCHYPTKGKTNYVC